MSTPLFITKEKWTAELNHMAGRLALTQPGETDLIDYLYGRLNIIDTKASSLLTFNGIFLAAFAVAVTEDFQNAFPQLNAVANSPAIVKSLGVTWLLSSFLCFWINLLRWRHLDKPDASGLVGNLSSYKQTIARVTVRRTLAYNIALILIMLDVAGLALFVLVT